MADITLLPIDYLTRVERWLGDAITSPDEIEVIVRETGVNMGKVELRGNPDVQWHRAVRRIALEGRFHQLLNGLAINAPNADHSSEIQKFSIEYDGFVVNKVIADASSLKKELDGLISADEPRALALLGQKIRDSVREIRAQIDDDSLWRVLPLTTSGYAAEDVRDLLSTTCLRVVEAADGLINETRMLTFIIDDNLTQDPDAFVRRRRQQFGAMTKAKLTLAERGRSLIKAVRTATPLDFNTPDT